MENQPLDPEVGTDGPFRIPQIIGLFSPRNFYAYFKPVSKLDGKQCNQSPTRLHINYLLDNNFKIKINF